MIVNKDGGDWAWQFEALSTVERTQLSSCWAFDCTDGAKLQLLDSQCDEKSTDK